MKNHIYYAIYIHKIYIIFVGYRNKVIFIMLYIYIYIYIYIIEMIYNILSDLYMTFINKYRNKHGIL
jgi:hypothetical protein